MFYWEDGVWVNRGRKFEVFDHAGNVTEVTFRDGAGNAWINHSRLSFAFNEQDNIRLTLRERWENDEWTPGDRRTTWFDADGNQLTTLVEAWSWGEWVNWYRTTYEYESVSAAVESRELLDSERPTLHPSWPNPSHGETSFSFSLPEAANVRLEVFDLLGRRVQCLVEREMAPGDHHLRTSLAELPAGTYVYRLRAGDYETSRALVVHH